MADELKSLLEEQGKATSALREYAGRLEVEVKKLGVEMPETKNALDKINTRLDEIEVKQKQIAAVKEEPKGGPSAEFKAFDRWARMGDGKITDAEKKVLVVGTDTGAGYLAPEEYVRTITKGVSEFSPIRSIATVRSTSNKQVNIPRRTGQFSAAWVAEQGTKAETTGLAYGLDVVTLHECYAEVRISNEMLEDSAFNLEAEVAGEAAEQFSVLEGTAFCSGTGIGQPEGLWSNSSVSHIASGHATALTADGIVKLPFQIKEPYWAGSQYIFSRSTLQAARILKDGMGAYLWQPSFAAGTPATLNGFPYTLCTDAPTIGAGTFPVMFGNFRRAYVIVDRLAIEMLRDPYTLASSGTVKFLLRRRVGGVVVLTEALYKLEIAAS